MMAEETQPTLFLLPTVLAPETAETVLSPQIREVISRTDIFFVENLRTARRFISELKTGRKIDELTFFELHKDTPRAQTQQQVKDLLKLGKDAGILSEAGCPGIADPGAVAVGLAHENGLRVTSLVGPSSILLTLMGSGFNGQSFTFHGYLPIDKGERSKRIRELEKKAQSGQTQLFMETPYRNGALFDDLLRTCQPHTLLCLGSNLTAEDELLRTLTIKQWQQQKPDLHKKPTMFALGTY
ncbi:SAM-dependent methyltransferase [Siphonobacter sp. SORGH_AS_0500]|uniref:SAM-dependent methyltransferase n=1 Tax=Siphonobacter sp. SORGH_AS_0500 TaxID=1864824 RepID=UPI00285AFBD3|nr:SAM-dependent methyltransferase [Siphonobacter sp. SORGH_AS_0500]MDR6195598.1 16S rRNA (cytidine1402-2'-O)-methyltransferase [Siphonobacter sp. SORGH_AS_0500]